MQCPHCDSEIDYCPCCGNLLATNPANQSLPKYCRHCGEPIHGINKKYCRRCGTPLSRDAGSPISSSSNQLNPSLQPIFFEDLYPNYFYCASSSCSSQTIFAHIYFESSLHNRQLLVTLEKPSYLIGKVDAERDFFPEIDLSEFDDFGFISRRHARILRQNNQFFIEDIGSVNGTYIYERGKKVRLTVKTPYPLRHGSRIHIGNVIGLFTVARETQSLTE